MSATANTPREIDTALAEKFGEIAKAEQQVAYNASSLYSLARAKFYYRGRRRVTDMPLAEAIEKAKTAAARVAEYKATHGYVDGDYHGTDWSEWSGPVAPHEADKSAEALAKRAELTAELTRLSNEAMKLEESYTGWSRFFLVTSSVGHIHSSRSCSTCRPTTTFGWLPGLSGKTEAEAVEAHGPALCSVCFPSAPVEWTSAKITKAKAEKAAH